MRTFAVLVLSVGAAAVAADEPPDLSEFAPWFQAQMSPRPPVVRPEGDVVRPKTAQDWQQLIDATWGDGSPTIDKLAFFDLFWDTIDRRFPCFQGLDTDWDALRTLYVQEIASGVSRGRFAAIMGRLSLELMETHTFATIKQVAWGTQPEPGVPLLNVGAWGYVPDFGACLTPLPDDTLLVYRAPDDHPFELEPGDLVIGFDGRPWSELYPELLGFGLPVAGTWGSSHESYEHAWLMAAGANWHLFDTIQVRRHDTGETASLPTELMFRWGHRLWCTEQLDVAGVEFPDYWEQEIVSWGIVDGTRIGYIYGWGWGWDADWEFFNAVRRLMPETVTDGLIIDFRFNLGGDLSLSNSGLSLLFNSEVSTIDWVTRCDPDDHLGLCVEGLASSFVIPGSPETFYDRPIAVLVGPGAASSGDQVALRMTFHPRARIFGRSTNTAFNAAAIMTDGPDYYAQYAVIESFLLSNPGEYLTHDPFVVDDEVWLTPDDVAAGRDTVVEAAIRWIRGFSRPRGPSDQLFPPTVE